jgi:hypothetical protein
MMSGKDILKSIEYNQNKFGYSDDLKQILINTVNYYFLKEEVKKYNITINDVKVDKYTHIYWICESIGFGELVVENETHNIIDDECMSEEFCKQVLSIVREDYFENLE